MYSLCIITDFFFSLPTNEGPSVSAVAASAVTGLSVGGATDRSVIDEDTDAFLTLANDATITNLETSTGTVEQLTLPKALGWLVNSTKNPSNLSSTSNTGNNSGTGDGSNSRLSRTLAMTPPPLSSTQTSNSPLFQSQVFLSYLFSIN